MTAWLDSLSCSDPEWRQIAEAVDATAADPTDAAPVGRAWLAWPGREAWIAAHPHEHRWIR